MLRWCSGRIGARKGHEGGCLDECPGSVLNPIAHPHQYGRDESRSLAPPEKDIGAGVRIKCLNVKWVISEPLEYKCMFKMHAD